MCISNVGCHNQVEKNESSGNEHDTVFVTKIVHDTIRDTVLSETETIIRESPPYYEIENKESNLYTMSLTGDTCAYSNLVSSRLSHRFVILPYGLAHYMASVNNVSNGYLNCFECLEMPYSNLVDINEIDLETKMLSLYYLQQGARLGNKMCVYIIESHKRHPEFRGTFEFEISRFYYDNDRKNVKLVFE